MQEKSFVASDLALEIIGDFAIVWLLSPKKAFKPKPSNPMARWIAALPGHCLQASPAPMFDLSGQIRYFCL